MRIVTVLSRAASAGVACALLLSGCGRGQAGQPAEAADTPGVQVAEARSADAEYALTLPARVQAGESAQLFARATGQVAERRVELGDAVAAGQVLATIAAPEVEQSVREAEAALARAEAELTLARGHHARAEAMLETQLISREDYSDRLGARDAAQAQLRAAQAQLASARDRQAFLQVRAPFAGIVSERNIERGDRVVGDAAGVSEPMFRIDALDPLRVIVDIPQRVALQVRPGLRAELVFPELPQERFEAEVVRTAQRISDEAGGMRVELRLPNPGSRIPSGMVGQVRLQVPRAAPATVVPLAALVQDAGQARVARVADGVVHFTEVTVGRNLGNEVEVVGGLEAGDRVVLAPNALLADGTRVREQAPDAR
ncbi:efflux RND transporter periplasmic adaptor subunit [Luteimonas sp. BDR2-5]|uniref:efflux RND transporter periplasmic adaptor subunit n=1 Tax=Proluteimonas luteida TaxID=2878685 RepID=UPI001E4A91F4|nr:efflux RND transporter periplasmic adaptor subunit [Luteimonas sp. BDR2-5]MCD9027426.1 efflux RND transporter periplasmic adaptor subunit [Luteimonas sp. BDR2-5]